MKNSIFKICDASIQPGESVTLALPLPEYNSCTTFIMPIKVIHGKTPGPCILIFSGLNGDELNGIEIINRLMKLEAMKSLNGTLIAIPIINIPALVNPSFVPYEKKLEECFPGSLNGGYGERIAQIFTQEILAKASYAIELRTGAISNELLPQLYCDITNEDAKKLAKKFSAPVISHIVKNNSLQETAASLNVPFLIYKAGEAKRFDEFSIHTGVSGIVNILSTLEMISQDEHAAENSLKPIFSNEQDWVRAHRSGIIINMLSLGNYVKENEVIGYIQDPFNADIMEEIKAAKDGIIIGINRNPLVFEGQNIFKLATFIDNSRAEISFEEWKKLQESLL